ncbi:RNA 2',3'-cyclic phosphodiesterase [Paenibacillus doosanensis]|uniref:RNA 2',3'-cyclic phosphodiesterase n=1 Tax=Paenibacillus doosanensis TaxID=1229154 RepID=UPI00217F7592|nr:RNA 2',3'-cyclic phosphodiesterase [Paenibacillus doosanensis]MCS7462770.1 RNA 2',3'-cyclic phosphodiesterase [Paenibacillus doosanensis]
MTKDRLFIAIPVPPQPRSELSKLMEQLQPKLAFRKWVYPDDLHITLTFLGDTDTVTADKVKAAMNDAASAGAPFRLQLGRLGTFGRPPAPSVLWMGVQGELDALHSLQSRIEQSVMPLGFRPEDRPYRPHITIARKYADESPFPPAAELDSEWMRSGESSWSCSQFVLYRTRMNHQPMYEILARFSM